MVLKQPIALRQATGLKHVPALKRVAGLFIATWGIHTLDHARRGLDDTTEAVVWAGTIVGLMAAVVITLIMVGHPTAPALAAAVFPSITFGVSASHMLPEWSALSDPLLVDSASDGWSVVAAGSEIVAAAIVGVVAIRILMRHDFRWRIDSVNWI